MSKREVTCATALLWSVMWRSVRLNSPVFFQVLSYALPLRYFFEIIRGIFLRGVGLGVLWPQATALLVYAIGTLSLSTLRFRKTLT